ncbi:MAG: hypothetical protein OYH77_04670 [Pseudomonadota bacterium]|nr:hypothetical protein [Pseudomonadota bacterium]
MNFRYALIVAMLLVSGKVKALPLGFGIHQDRLQYEQLTHPHFRFYYDARTEDEARFMLQALVKARPILEGWLGVERQKPLAVITSAVTYNPSFANFIADVIELQSLGMGTRGLAWHEYVHMLNYQHFHNIFGAAGAVLHLPWHPSWWLEGLAEALTQSLGSSNIKGIERHHAWSDSFVSYDRLHYLYAGIEQAQHGYPVASSFALFVLKKLQDKGGLPALIKSFYRKSMPWHWPLTLVPFASELPFDRALREHTGFDGRSLYQQYKDSAKAYWQQRRGVFLPSKGGEVLFGVLDYMQARDNKLHTLSSKAGEVSLSKIRFANNRATAVEDTGEAVASDHAIFSPQVGTDLFLRYEKNIRTGIIASKLIANGANKQQEELQIGSIIIKKMFAVAGNRIMFLEHELGTTRLCYYVKGEWHDKRCLISEQYPRSLAVLGFDKREDRIWLRRQTNTVHGDSYQLLSWQPAEGMRRHRWRYVSKPEQVAFVGGKMMVMLLEYDYRTVVEVNKAMRCVRKLRFANHITGVFSHADRLVLALYHTSGNTLAIPTVDEIAQATESCQHFSRENSPLDYAIGKPNTTLTQALHSFERPDVVRTAVSSSTTDSTLDLQPHKVHWGGRPLFVFPIATPQDWQLGIISVPLMGILQNETVVAKLAYGIKSGTPSADLTFSSTRYLPHLQFRLFKNRVFNGIVEDKVNYLDAVGLNMTAGLRFHHMRGGLSLSLGLGVAQLESRQVAQQRVGQGIEVSISSAVAYRYYRDSSHEVIAKIWNKYHPFWLNKNFDYNRTGVHLDLRYHLPLLGIQLHGGSEASITIGGESRNLREVYYPFDGRFAEMGTSLLPAQVPLLYSHNSLASRYGDAQAKLRAALVYPVWRDIGKLFWILYADRLNLTAFVNYGGAWSIGDALRVEDFIFTHGYSADLLFNNSGVDLRFGLGTGWVDNRSVALFANAGIGVNF